MLARRLVRKGSVVIRVVQFHNKDRSLRHKAGYLEARSAGGLLMINATEVGIGICEHHVLYGTCRRLYKQDIRSRYRVAV